jgi:hypothetical protein
MRAVQHGVDVGAVGREQLDEPSVDLLERRRRQCAPSDVRLVGDDDETEAERAQASERIGRARDQLDLVRMAQVVDLLVDRPVAIEQHETAGGMRAAGCHRGEGAQWRSPRRARTPSGSTSNGAN